MPKPKKSNVASLFGCAPPVPQVVPDVVERLEKLLSEARDGAIVGLAYVRIASAANVGTGWVGTADRHRLIAGAGILHHRMLTQAAEDDG